MRGVVSHCELRCGLVWAASWWVSVNTHLNSAASEQGVLKLMCKAHEDCRLCL